MRGRASRFVAILSLHGERELKAPKCGHINTTGTFVIPIEREARAVYPFSGALARFDPKTADGSIPPTHLDRAGVAIAGSVSPAPSRFSRAQEFRTMPLSGRSPLVLVRYFRRGGH